VPVQIDGAEKRSEELAKHKKNESVGMKTVWFGEKVYVEQADAQDFILNTNVTFMEWGNITITKILRDPSGSKVLAVNGKLDLDNKNFKNTHKCSWVVADVDEAQTIPLKCVNYDNLITKAILDKEDDFKNFINTNSMSVENMIGETSMANIKPNDIVQIQRKGFYRCDKAYEPPSLYTCKAQPCVLFYIPDGHTKQKEKTGRADKIKSKPKEKKPNNEKKSKSKSSASPKEVDKLAKEINETLVTLENAQKEMSRLLSQYKSTTGCDYKASSPASGDAQQPNTDSLYSKVTEQGLIVRQLKANKADKATVKAAVDELLKLKTDYKNTTGKDYKPAGAEAPKQGQNPTPTELTGSVDLFDKVTAQGDLVRKLKSEKADKVTVKAAVDELLKLKKDYKKATGKDYKPAAAGAPKQSQNPAPTELTGSVDLFDKVTAQGDLVRKLKSEKADKVTVKAAVDELLKLKADYKKATGKDYKPAATGASKQAQKPAPAVSSDAAEHLYEKVTAQGDLVRKLKSDKADKKAITAAVNELLKLKGDYKQTSGKDYTAAALQKVPKQEKKIPKKISKVAPKSVKKVTRLGLEATKEEDLAGWYNQVLTKGEMIEYYDVSGCYVLRSWSYGIWERIKEFFDLRIKSMGVENCYFPMFVSKAALEKEKEHIEDFAPEVAWVTRSGDTELAEPIAIRPTSETVMYPIYSKWVQSHRDLPICRNQWCNVVRWEFKNPQPFLRTREFLWQEGHSAFATKPEAEVEVMTILDHYADVYEELLAIPVVKGRKTEKEKFAGGDYTTTIEAFISASGRAIQAATSHHLGQNFSKMFDISFEDPNKAGEKCYAYQNSWGITTRTIGVLVMIHGDDLGLVLPPRVANIQVVIIACGLKASTSDVVKNEVVRKCEDYVKLLTSVGVRAHYDARENYSPGWKFNHWELKGVPIRLEVGPNDLKKGQCSLAIRFDASKQDMLETSVASDMPKLLEKIQSDMKAKATRDLMTNMVVADTWADFLKYLDEGKIIQTPFCGEKEAEKWIKQNSARDQDIDANAPSMGAKSLCYPFEPLKQLKEGQKCISGNGKPAQAYCLFGRSY